MSPSTRQLPESIDYVKIGPLTLAALDRRHAGRREGELPRLIPALVLARRFNIRPHGSDDSRKRGVRLLINQLRRDGAPILANYRGYYLGGEPEDWAIYAEFRRKQGFAHLVGAAEAERSQAHADAEGQLGLFIRRK